MPSDLMRPSELPRTAMLGVGSMSGAVLDGLVAAGADRSRFRVTTRSAESAASHREAGLDAVALEEDPTANSRAVRGAYLVVVGVKPAMVPDLLRSVAEDLEPGALVVSVAVGVTSATMEGLLPPTVRVVRALPNTPVAVGRGVTGVSAGSRSTAEDLALASSLFSASGDVVEVPEVRLDALSAVSGSGPAYVFLLVEQWQAAARELGFDADEAAVLVQGTLRGAIALLDSSDRGPADLRRAVTSPKGTTEKAIEVLEEADLGGVLLRASRAAIARAEEISRA